jgi:type VI secretion system protein ImpE
MVQGDWERAATQLSVLGEMDAGSLPMVHAYRSAMQCERLRLSVMQGERSPLIFGDPAPWLALLVQSLSALASGRTAEADALRAEALAGAPAVAGTLNGEPFDWIADADSRLGPVLEAMVNGAYYWIPFQRVARLHLEPPADLRDLVWLPAQFTWANGGEALGFIPARYSGSEVAGDSALLLARRTEWRASACWRPVALKCRCLRFAS